MEVYFTQNLFLNYIARFSYICCNWQNSMIVFVLSANINSLNNITILLQTLRRRTKGVEWYQTALWKKAIPFSKLFFHTVSLWKPWSTDCKKKKKKKSPLLLFHYFDLIICYHDLITPYFEIITWNKELLYWNAAILAQNYNIFCSNSWNEILLKKNEILHWKNNRIARVIKSK